MSVKSKEALASNRGEWKSNARNGHYRCNICDKTSGSFFKDISQHGHLCFSCMSEVQELKTDYRISDEIKEQEKLLSTKGQHESNRLHKGRMSAMSYREKIPRHEGSPIYGTGADS